jgi:hypothetical protein
LPDTWGELKEVGLRPPISATATIPASETGELIFLLKEAKIQRMASLSYNVCAIYLYNKHPNHSALVWSLIPSRHPRPSVRLAPLAARQTFQPSWKPSSPSPLHSREPLVSFASPNRPKGGEPFLRVVAPCHTQFRPTLFLLNRAKLFSCHTSEELTRNSFPCHTCKNTPVVSPLFATHPKRGGTWLTSIRSVVRAVHFRILTSYHLLSFFGYNRPVASGAPRSSPGALKTHMPFGCRN